MLFRFGSSSASTPCVKAATDLKEPFHVQKEALYWLGLGCSSLSAMGWRSDGVSEDEQKDQTDLSMSLEFNSCRNAAIFPCSRCNLDKPGLQRRKVSFKTNDSKDGPSLTAREPRWSLSLMSATVAALLRWNEQFTSAFVAQRASEVKDDYSFSAPLHNRLQQGRCLGLLSSFEQLADHSCDSWNAFCQMQCGNCLDYATNL